MSPILSVDNVSLAYGLEKLLDSVTLQISLRERIALIGRNGTGKSSLLKLIEGLERPDSGLIWRKPGIKLARLEQTLPSDSLKTVFDYVAEGLEGIGALLTQYHQLLSVLASHTTQHEIKQLETLQHAIDAQQGWQYELRINTMLERLQLDATQKIAGLSGGWQRRAALAKAWVKEPDLLLLDEPTNHLDIEGIEWLEESLNTFPGALVFITHDRALLKRLANRIIELDRGKLTSWSCDYDNFLKQKQALLDAEEKHHADFDKKLAQEEVWIRQGIKARRTRNEGRVRALEKMRRERQERRTPVGNVTLSLNQSKRSGQLVIEAESVSYECQHKKIIDNFSISIKQGDRIGLIGPNGVGKTTLLNLLLGKISPASGHVKQGTQLEIAYFDQLRESLAWDKTAIDNVTDGSDFVEFDGKKLHVISYLNDFLFTPLRARTPIRVFSGGECNRLLLAKLFSKPSNLLILDEPTNDLDIETLELLEEVLLQYKGTLLLVSHDREFLDHVVTSTLVFEGHGHVQEYNGGYHDWLQQRKEKAVLHTPVPKKKDILSEEKKRASNKLSFKEQRELNELPSKIQALEHELEELQQLTQSTDFYQQDQKNIINTMERMHELTALIEKAYARWMELE